MSTQRFFIIQKEAAFLTQYDNNGKIFTVAKKIAFYIGTVLLCTDYIYFYPLSVHSIGILFKDNTF